MKHKSQGLSLFRQSVRLEASLSVHHNSSKIVVVRQLLTRHHISKLCSCKCCYFDVAVYRRHVVLHSCMKVDQLLA